MIVVRFTCAGCNLNEKKVEIRYRHPNETVTKWMDHVTLMISRCHVTVSPRCRARKMKEVKIPVPDNEAGIGMAPRNEPPTDEQLETGA